MTKQMMVWSVAGWVLMLALSAIAEDKPTIGAKKGATQTETVDAAAFGFDPAATPEANAAALQKALAGGRKTVTVSKPGKYLLGAQVLLDSDTVLDCAKGVVFEKARRFPCLLVNRGAFTGGCNSNIVVRGLEIHAAPNKFNVRASEASGCLGLRTCLGFVHARDIAVERFRFFDRTEDEYCLAYVIQFSDFANVRVEDFEIRAKKDGIHLNKGRGFVIRNGVTTTWDDAVAINAGDWPVAVSEQMGSIEDGLVENVRDEPWTDGPWKFEKLHANFSRVITGCWQEWRKGMEVVRGDIFKIGTNVYSVVFPSGFKETRVSTVPPTHDRGIWTSPEGIPYLCIQHDGGTRADVRNVTFRNITLAYDRPIFCNWEIGAGKARLVHPDIPPKDYPVTEITLENVVGEQKTALVTGTASFDVTMRRCRARNLLVDVKEHPNRPTVRRIVLEDCPLSAKDADKVDFRIDGAEAEIVVKGVSERLPKAVGTAKPSVVAARASLSAARADVKIVSVDCTKPAPEGQYFGWGRVVVTNGAAGAYREAGDAEDSRFGYRFTVRHPGRPHRLVVRYPDDRTRSFAVSDGTCYDLSFGIFTGAAMTGHQGRHYTGLVQPLTNRMIEQENLFWPRWTDCSVVFSNAGTGAPAAAASFEVWELDGLEPFEIPAADYPRRSFGTSYEDPCSHASDLGSLSFDDWLDRVVTLLRHQGHNRFVYPLVWYHGPLYPSAVNDAHYFEWSVASPKDRKLFMRWTGRPADWPEKLLTRFDREGLEFMAQACFIRLSSLMKHFNPDVKAIAAGADVPNVIWADGYVQDGACDWTTQYNVTAFDAICTANEQGKRWQDVALPYGEQAGAKGKRCGPIFDPAHPLVREATLAAVRDIAVRYAKHPSFRGLKAFAYDTTFLGWRYLDCGFGDATVARFERETGVKVPAPKTGMERFAARAKVIKTREIKPKWVAWRCKVVTELLAAMRDELRKVRPDLEFCVEIKPSREGGRDPAEWHAAGVGLCAGIDGGRPCTNAVDVTAAADYYNVFNSWVERWGNFRHWHCAPGEADGMSTVLGRPAEGIVRMGSGFPPDGFWWPDAQMRISPAYSGGVHFLRHYAEAMATTDPLVLTRGGLIFDRSHVKQMRAFASAFRALPRVKFETLKGTEPSVVVRTALAEGARWLYAVNRTGELASATLFMKDPKPHLENGTGAPQPTPECWQIRLEPYQLRTFALPPETMPR